MKRKLFLLFFSIIVVTAEFQDKAEDDFLKAGERCIRRERIPSGYKAKFDTFQYPDEPVVHRYLHCVWLELELWNNNSGFDVERIADLYKTRANTEILIPILTECNRRNGNESPLKWCYRAFKCIFDSQVGQWFRDDVSKKMRENQSVAG